jgi:four helix bundle protein
MGNFQELKVWQLARELAVSIYRLTQNREFSKDFGFKDQIQRSAVSIPSIFLKEMNLKQTNNRFVIFILQRDLQLNC